MRNAGFSQVNNHAVETVTNSSGALKPWYFIRHASRHLVILNGSAADYALVDAGRKFITINDRIRKKMAKIGFIGCGKMAQVLIGAFINGGIIAASEVICSDINPELLNEVSKTLGVETTSDNTYVFDNAEVIFLATKPQSFPQAILDCQGKVNARHVIVSIMAGVTIAKIKSFLPAPVVRVMPNTPCLVGQMAAGYAVGDGVGAEKVVLIEKLLNCAGLAIEVAEKQLDAVTGLSGSGPAFVAWLIKHFVLAGSSLGLSENDARELALQTFAGTAVLLQKKELSPEKLIEMVSSPNGTTVAGREILESSDVGDVIIRTVARAAQRSEELSK